MNRILFRLRSLFDKLGVRLALVLAVALLPLMIVSIVRSQSVFSAAIERSQAALVGETLRAVRKEVNIIERAKAVAKALSSSFPDMMDDPVLCNKLMRDMLTDTVFSFAGYYDVTGNVPCSSAPEPFSFGLNPALEAQVADPKPTVLVNQDAPASGTSVIYASYPVFADDGVLLGFTAISVPHQRLRDNGTTKSKATFLTLNSEGTVLTAMGPLDEAEELLPRLESMDSILRQPTSFRAFGRDGIERLYSLIPVVEEELYALSTWPLEDQTNGDFYLRNPALFPALMWFASLAVAWFATSLFVTRHVVKLRRAMQNFAATRMTTAPSEFVSAPGELRDVAEAFTNMTDTILHDEAQIEDVLRQKDILLREVHHRVKNNLQLIASIMSMQMRQSKSKEVHRLMQSLHDRVNSLATIHRNLYQTSGQADISMDEHLDSIVRQVVRMASARDTSVDLKTEFADIRLNPDQAVPLSLFVTEAVTNALKYIGSIDGATPTLRVNLALVNEGIAAVEIVNSVASMKPETDAETSSGLGSELMEAFAEQLAGTFTARPVQNEFAVHLAFPIEPLNAKS